MVRKPMIPGIIGFLFFPNFLQVFKYVRVSLERKIWQKNIKKFINKINARFQVKSSMPMTNIPSSVRHDLI